LLAAARRSFMSPIEAELDESIRKYGKVI